MSETYACAKCTYVQSIRIPTCEMCSEPNPNVEQEEFPEMEREERTESPEIEPEERAESPRIRVPFPDFMRYFQLRTSNENGMITCKHCDYVNVGYDIDNCEGCGKDPRNIFDFGSFLYDDFGDPDEPYESPDDDDENEAITTEEFAPIDEFKDDDELLSYYNQYILLVKNEKEQAGVISFHQLQQLIRDLYESLREKSGQSNDNLIANECQVCCGDDQPLVKMKVCGHQIICADDFHSYVSSRIQSGDILPWITCPAASCHVPCHADDLLQHTQLTYNDLSTFLINFMIQKLRRNANYLGCSNCDRGGFLQIGESKKQHVQCPVCRTAQIIEKGVHAGLDSAFQQMINAGTLRECPSCRHLTMKEKGICNVIHCVKCGIWWNWRTRDQGHSERDMKQRARAAGTLWERGELDYQRRLEREKPKEFKALLERNGIRYDPNYRRGQ